MVCNDKKYRQVTNCIGIALIVLILLIQTILFTVPVLLQELLLPISVDLAYVVAMLAQIVFYMASFMIPAFILRAMLKRKGLLQPMRLGFKLEASSLWLVPAGIAVCFACSSINSYIMQIFVPADPMSSIMADVVPYTPYEIVLQFIATALVPAVCEEFLFRGAIASSLMPYGKGVAVVGSSVLFAFMHENPHQMFYTLIAGLILGYLYVKTGSILCSTILHFCNNATSVLMEICLTNLGEERGMFYYYIIIAVVYLLGAIGIIVYFAVEKRKKRGRFDDGAFGKLIEVEDGYARTPITKGKALEYFLTPAMVIYCCMAIWNMLSQIVILWLASVVLL